MFWEQGQRKSHPCGKIQICCKGLRCRSNRVCNFFYRFFVFVHFIVSVLYKDFQIFFFGVSPNISYCNRNRYITLLISKVNLRAYLFYDLLGLSGGLVFQNDYKLITADSVTLTVLFPRPVIVSI